MVVRKDSGVVINQDVDDNFIELIAKRYNSKKTYLKESEDLFKDLTELSSLSIHKTSSSLIKLLNISLVNVLTQL